MTKEIEQVKQKIQMLQSKLAFLEELEKTKSPIEEAYKQVFGNYPNLGEGSTEFDIQSWNIFQYGYKFGCGELPVEEIEKHNVKPKMTLENEGEFSIVSYNGVFYHRIQLPTSVYWYINSLVGKLEPIQDIKLKNELESAWLMNDVKYQNDDEPYCPDDPPEYDEIEWDEKDNPTEPTRNKYFERILNAPIDKRGYIDLRESTSEFRQKLFDGIKSVFYNPEYERTHWSVKVNMAVDEVITHFEDILPASQDPIYDDTDKGWNWCLSSIRTSMEKPNV
jgi:hypothetical protein